MSCWLFLKCSRCCFSSISTFTTLLFHLVIILNSILMLLLNQPNLTESCQIDNRQMHVCLHRYLERDFSLVEDLLKRPPFGENGRILIEETELENMCNRFDEMKQCYERMLGSCVSYAGYRHMIRVIKSIRLIYDELCDPETFNIKMLIEGGYCIEFVRSESRCSTLADQYYLTSSRLNLATDQNSSAIDSSDNKQSILSLPPPKQQWPYSLIAMLRFEAGINMCPYLTQFNRCMMPYIERRCHIASIQVWNISMTNIIDSWCSSSSSSPSRPATSISSLTFSFLTAVLLFISSHNLNYLELTI